mmetsp:Transcript_1873/g.3594  ORF Transcript_1873/g.3594 Transcript_1873/m.3594 type:complete len:95 (+) Transcript_1873:321-605(+)|eukprot:scaffold4855_cov195-Amphora_coffeaeformis.AAC.7
MMPNTTPCADIIPDNSLETVHISNMSLLDLQGRALYYESLQNQMDPQDRPHQSATLSRNVSSASTCTGINREILLAVIEEALLLLDGDIGTATL